jgi:8-oxo-dGTP pyrophosphatase MutT (NUDIX family)
LSLNLDKIKKETKILIEGKFNSEDFDCSYTQSYLPFDNKEKMYIEHEWSRVIKNRPFLFNGQLFHSLDYKYHNTKIMLRMCNSNFMEYIGTNTYEFNRLFGQNRIVRPISVGTMIITSDNKWVIGRRKNSFNYEGFYTLIAGYMDPAKDIINSKPEPFFALKRELEEEGGVHANDINKIICIGMIGENQPYLAFISTLNTSFEEFCTMIPDQREFLNLEGFDLKKRTIDDFVYCNYHRTTPHSIGNILLCYQLNLPDYTIR